jgi:ABC-type antimicrobial peptide transport system permease subunit
MLKNYFHAAWRNLRQNKVFSFINIIGLSVGISASLVIFLIVQYDYSFDRFERDGDRIFRIVSEYTFEGGSTGHTRGVQGPLANAVRKELTGVNQTISFRYYNAGKLAVPGADPGKLVQFKLPEHIIFADGQYFQLLDYKWLAGSPQSALNGPDKVVLSESRAKLYFPSTPVADLIGRNIIYDDTLTAQVSGIVEDLEKQGHTDFNFSEFISLPTVLDNSGLRSRFSWDDWGSTTSDQQLYVRLGMGVSVAAVEARLKVLFEKYRGEDEKKNHFTWTYFLQPLSDIHFNNQYGNFQVHLANKPTLYGMMLVAFFLLFLASINFINLSTAQATRRAREIGIRKTLGGLRRQLVFQFLGETFLITLVATCLSILLTPLLLKAFAGFIPEGLHFSLARPSLLAFLAVLVGAVSLLAGFYPALVMSSWKALEVLKNKVYYDTDKARSAWVRQGLTVSQFIIAQFFIMGTVLVSKQIRFMLDKDLGFTKEAILSFDTPHRDTSYGRRVYLLTQLKKIPGIRMVSLGNEVIFSFGWWTGTVEYKERKKVIQTVGELKSGDSNFLKLFHIPILAGRDLLPSDSVHEILINETYLHTLGFTQPGEAIGKTVHWNDANVPIVGVIKDFHAHALNYKIGPMIFFRSRDQSRDIVVSLYPQTTNGGSGNNKSGWQAAIAAMKMAFKQTYLDEDFSYAFLDDSVADAYGSEQKISQLLEWATGLTIFISCLGLLGLVIYITNRRTKEIGVRKVLGASVAQIVSILTKEFIALVGIAFLVATPLSWWSIHKWLDNFSFRTSISWCVFLVSRFGMIVLALVTLSVQTIRAAMANPAASLRTE